MENIISGLLKYYENGRLSRRDLVRGLATLAGTCTTASAAGLQSRAAAPLEINSQGGFKGDSINHIGLLVTDLDRSAKFYERLIGAAVVRDQATRTTSAIQTFLQVGKSHLTLIKDPSAPSKVNHVAIGVKNFSNEGVTAVLKKLGLPVSPLKGVGLGLHTADPDGFAVQIIQSDE
jgi:catechol 2,3-dioxygenase-like lactoylglutathione lyase family enzyme